MLRKSNRPDLFCILIKSSLLLGSVESKPDFRAALWMSQKQAQKNLPPSPIPLHVPSPDTSRKRKEREIPSPASPLLG